MADMIEDCGEVKIGGQVSAGEYSTAQSAWRGSLRALKHSGATVSGVSDPHSIGSHFGSKVRRTIELVGAGFRLTDPRNRLCHSSYRKCRLDFSIAQAIWAFTGSNDAAMITFYNPAGLAFSDDGTTFRAAIGYRCFGSPLGSPFENAIDRLKRDRATRRSVVPIYWPEDLTVDARDCSCVLSLQFLLRSGKVECIAVMRSQSVLMVLPYDLFLLTMCHEAAAISLGAKMGAFQLFCGSMHFYTDEAPLVKRVLSEVPRALERMDKMDRSPITISAELRDKELQVRDCIARGRPLHRLLTSGKLSPYWNGLLAAMGVDAQMRRNEARTDDIRLVPRSLVPLLYDNGAPLY